MNSTHRKIAVKLQSRFNISLENTARLVKFLAREFPTLSLSERTLRIDGAKLRKIRKAKRWSMRRLAKKLDMSQQQVANIEKGRSGTTRQRHIDIAEALNISVEEISF